MEVPVMQKVHVHRLVNDKWEAKWMANDVKEPMLTAEGNSWREAIKNLAERIKKEQPGVVGPIQFKVYLTSEQREDVEKWIQANGSQASVAMLIPQAIAELYKTTGGLDPSGIYFSGEDLTLLPPR
jgi:hypothetical protein